MTETNAPRPLNWSTLKHIARSPLHYRYRIDHPEPDKAEYLWGRAVHCAVLEPDEFNKRYAVCEVRRNKRDKAYREWMEENPDAEALKPHEMDSILRASDAVRHHRVAGRLLDGCRHEERIEWDDPDTGIRCSGRLDAISPEYIVDLKSSSNVTPRVFNLDCARYMVHGQLSLYQTGAVTLRLIDGAAPPYIVAVDKEPPHDVACYQFSFEDLAAGRNLVLSLMRTLELSMATDTWPGVAPDLVQLSLPPWTPGLEEHSDEEW